MLARRANSNPRGMMMAVIDTDTAEGKAKLQELIDAETKGLRDKKDELLGDLKKTKDSVKDLQAQFDELKAEKDKAETEAANKSGDVERIKADLQKQHKKELDKLTAERDAAVGTTNSLLIDGGLSEALAKSGVAPQHMDAVKALIKLNHKPEVAIVDGKAVARVGDASLTDFVSTWAQGDQGKHYIAAKDNGGGGASGSNGGSGAPAKGNMGGDKAERTAAIKAQFPELAQG